MGVVLDDLESSPDSEENTNTTTQAPVAPATEPVVQKAQPQPEPAYRATENHITQQQGKMDMSQEQNQFDQQAATDIFAQLANTASPLGSRSAEYGHRFKMAWTDAVKESTGKSEIDGYVTSIISGVSVGSPADIAALSHIGKDKRIVTYCLLLGGAAVMTFF